MSVKISQKNKYCMNCMKPMGYVGACRECGFDIHSYESSEQFLPMGTILYDNFMIGRVLGTGGFGITYVGLDIDRNQKIAIKEFYLTGYVNRNCSVSKEVSVSMNSDRELFEANREKFVREAQILAKFNREEGIAKVYQFFRANNTAYIIMEFVEGETLKEYLHKHGPLGYNDTLSIMMPVLKSLDKIHGANLIHRDISPDNIMVSPDKKVKLLDFGAARNYAEKNEHSLTVMLKVGYAPVEQYNSKGEQGPWTDVYAICATMFKCITGATPDDAMNRIYKDRQKSPGQMGINIPPAIENAIMRGLAVREEDRIQDIGSLIWEFSRTDVFERLYPIEFESGREWIGGDYNSELGHYTSGGRNPMHRPASNPAVYIGEEHSGMSVPGISGRRLTGTGPRLTGNSTPEPNNITSSRKMTGGGPRLTGSGNTGGVYTNPDNSKTTGAGPRLTGIPNTEYSDMSDKEKNSTALVVIGIILAIICVLILMGIFIMGINFYKNKSGSIETKNKKVMCMLDENKLDYKETDI